MESPNLELLPKHNSMWPAMILQCSYGAKVTTFYKATNINTVKGAACFNGRFRANIDLAAPLTLEERTSIPGPSIPA